jgi:hypothetical protein
MGGMADIAVVSFYVKCWVSELGYRCWMAISAIAEEAL